MKYRHKITYVDAMRFDGNNAEAILEWANIPQLEIRTIFRAKFLRLNGIPAREGDYIIRSANGNFYVMGPDCFAANYEDAGKFPTPE